ncbi:hypothetical protein ILUMI_09530 [Ignelater luminosus]|uniref:Uncharacterized protein n=1 Tax=Ignelater luminosus TaxID=2038154 RepID=A0A8K0CZK8_IGNLU|nr:hypothetical protein ILUMI_09530 [Ignelater luminosus]
MDNYSTRSTLQAYETCTTPEKASKGLQVRAICFNNPDVLTEENFEPARLHDIANTNENEVPSMTHLHSPGQQQAFELGENKENPNKERSFLDILPLPEPSKSKIEITKRETGKPKAYKEVSFGDKDIDDEDKDKDAKGIDICLVCGEFGKNDKI